MLMSRIARWMSSPSARSTASAPFAASAATSRSGSASSTSLSPLRTIAWSSATRTRVFSGIGMSVSAPSGHFEPDFDATVVPGLDRECCVDDQRALADSPEPAALDAAFAEAAAVVGDAQDHAARASVGLSRLERQNHRTRVGVARDVREALLRDPVDDELGLRIERRQIACDVDGGGDPRSLGETGRESLE